uniref:Uncharacterized protein n=1 Tax=Moniliophthora roreri TaxID=221103 RepID=A0A0W0EZN9_MONRR
MKAVFIGNSTPTQKSTSLSQTAYCSSHIVQYALPRSPY